MNQVWLFFKLIEILLGCLCMFIHVQGSMYLQEPIPHVIIYCATFMSYTVTAALGALRLLLVRSCVLSTQLLLTLSAVILHYLCALLVMRTSLKDPHKPNFNTSFEWMEHPHFAYCKQQSIASLVTGTMYLMHMFHVFDLLIRMEPGEWKRQATGLASIARAKEAGARGGLFVLSRPVDDFLCNNCRCYYNLAHSQALLIKTKEMEETNFLASVWNFFRNLRSKFFTVAHVESDESFMSTPSITTTSESESTFEDNGENEGGRRRYRTTWRGASDSSSLWAQIEDRSTPKNSRTSQGSNFAAMPNQMERMARRSTSVWDRTERRDKSDILLVEQNTSLTRLQSQSKSEVPRSSKEILGHPQMSPGVSIENLSETYDEPRSSRSLARESNVIFKNEKGVQSSSKTSISKSESPKSVSAGGYKSDKSGEGESQEERKGQK